MRRAELEELIERDPSAVVEFVLALQERIEELERRLGQNSGNSSKPPSSDPPMSRQERRAPARERAKESLRKQGGQPGHEGSHRQMAPPEWVDEAFEHRPERCSGCGHGFDGEEQRVGDPVAHQKWELPPIRPQIGGGLDYGRWPLANRNMSAIWRRRLSSTRGRVDSPITAPPATDSPTGRECQRGTAPPPRRRGSGGRSSESGS